MALRDVKFKLKEKTDQTLDWLDEIRLPGFKKVGLYQVSRFFINGLSDRRFSISAMGMAYRFIFAIFPALILVFTTVPRGFHDEILGFFQQLVPADAFQLVKSVVDEFFDKPGFGLISFNFIIMLWSSLSGIKVMMYAFSRNDDLFKKRNFFHVNFVAFLILVVLAVLFLMILGIVIFGEYLIMYDGDTTMERSDWVATLFRIGYWIVIFSGLQLGVSVLYYLGPETKERWSFFSPGSILAGILTLLALVAFRYFFGQFANFNKIYGSISALMLMMFWFYWISVVLLIGFELNRAIDRARERAIRKGLIEIELEESPTAAEEKEKEEELEEIPIEENSQDQSAPQS